MIGCIAQAKNDTVHMDDTEMEEVRWVSRADVAKALDRSSSKDNPLTGDNSHGHPIKPSAARPTAIVEVSLPLNIPVEMSQLFPLERCPMSYTRPPTPIRRRVHATSMRRAFSSHAHLQHPGPMMCRDPACMPPAAAMHPTPSGIKKLQVRRLVADCVCRWEWRAA